MIRLEPVRPEHIAAVALNMRPADRDEIWASHHARPHQALVDGVAMSTYSRAVIAEETGEAVCIFGVSPVSLLTGVGTPWMLGTPGLACIRRPFLRASAAAVEVLHQSYPLLRNWVDNRNTATHRWLEWLGFELDPPAPFGVEGLPFRRFTRTMPCAHP